MLSSVQSLSCVQLFVTPWTAAYQASLSVTNSQSLLKLMPIKLVVPSSHLVLCHPFSSCLQYFPASGSFPRSQFFTSGGQSIGVSSSISPSNEYSGRFPLGWTGLIFLQSKGQASLSVTNSQSLLKLMPIKLVMPSNHPVLCYPLLFPT